MMRKVYITVPVSVNCVGIKVGSELLVYRQEGQGELDRLRLRALRVRAFAPTAATRLPSAGVRAHQCGAVVAHGKRQRWWAAGGGGVEVGSSVGVGWHRTVCGRHSPHTHRIGAPCRWQGGGGKAGDATFPGLRPAAGPEVGPEAALAGVGGPAAAAIGPPSAAGAPTPTASQAAVCRDEAKRPPPARGLGPRPTRAVTTVLPPTCIALSRRNRCRRISRPAQNARHRAMSTCSRPISVRAQLRSARHRTENARSQLDFETRAVDFDPKTNREAMLSARFRAGRIGSRLEIELCAVAPDLNSYRVQVLATRCRVESMCSRNYPEPRALAHESAS